MNAQTTGSSAAKAASPATTSTSGRKAWTKRTPIEIFLEQISKQEEQVARLRQGLAREERELTKLQQAKKVLEAT